MAQFGLLGEHLSHSWSAPLHRLLGGYDYGLHSVSPEHLAEFLHNTPYLGLNVTIPYKKAVIPYCTELSPIAMRLGSVNTMVRTPSGWYGHNTDYQGFCRMAREFPVKNAHVLVLGSGGAGVMAVQALYDLGAARVDTVSRTGEINYENADRTADIIVNATPVGMYPNNGQAPLPLREFPNCRGVIDLIYNPLRTKLIMDAEALGIACCNGLPMLAAQAAAAAEAFTGRLLTDCDSAFRSLQKQQENIILIGMPGCGKTTVGQLAAQALSRPFADSDAVLAQRCGSVSDYLEQQGEAAFRSMETEVLRELGKQTGIVLATGGGAVTRQENYSLLRQNGRLFWLCRDPALLPVSGRPLSKLHSPEALYRVREPLYRAWADDIIDNSGTAQAAAEAILEVVQ